MVYQVMSLTAHKVRPRRTRTLCGLVRLCGVPHPDTWEGTLTVYQILSLTARKKPSELDPKFEPPEVRSWHTSGGPLVFPATGTDTWTVSMYQFLRCPRDTGGR